MSEVHYFDNITKKDKTFFHYFKSSAVISIESLRSSMLAPV